MRKCMDFVKRLVKSMAMSMRQSINDMAGKAQDTQRNTISAVAHRLAYLLERKEKLERDVAGH